MTKRAPQRACVGCGKRTSGYDGGVPKCNDCRGVRRLVWADVLARAAAIVESYDTKVTLRLRGFRTRPLALTWASMQPARIR